MTVLSLYRHPYTTKKQPLYQNQTKSIMRLNTDLVHLGHSVVQMYVYKEWFIQVYRAIYYLGK